MPAVGVVRLVGHEIPTHSKPQLWAMTAGAKLAEEHELQEVTDITCVAVLHTQKPQARVQLCQPFRPTAPVQPLSGSWPSRSSVPAGSSAVRRLTGMRPPRLTGAPDSAGPLNGVPSQHHHCTVSWVAARQRGPPCYVLRAIGGNIMEAGASEVGGVALVGAVVVLPPPSLSEQHIRAGSGRLSIPWPGTPPATVGTAVLANSVRGKHVLSTPRLMMACAPLVVSVVPVTLRPFFVEAGKDGLVSIHRLTVPSSPNLVTIEGRETRSQRSKVALRDRYPDDRST